MLKFSPLVIGALSKDNMKLVLLTRHLHFSIHDMKTTFYNLGVIFK